MEFAELGLLFVHFDVKLLYGLGKMDQLPNLPFLEDIVRIQVPVDTLLLVDRLHSLNDVRDYGADLLL